MKLSEAWLREWVDPPLTTEQLAEQLTMTGLEIDSLTPVTADIISTTSTANTSDAEVDTDHYLPPEDFIFDICITPNRADCLSVAGIAREVGMLNHLPVNAPKIAPVIIDIHDSIPISINTPKECPRYVARVIKNIDATVKTPHWIQEKLRRSGIHCTHSVMVDITNYVQLELGQPLHTYDLATIEGEIIVRLATSGEQLTLLDDRSVILDNDTLVIADRRQLLALAGIMGGKRSAVHAKTTAILLESAYFDPRSIAGSARRYGLTSEAAYRFERGTDATIPHRAIERATALLLALCGGVSGPVIDRTDVSHLPQPITITLRRQKLERIIGEQFFEDLLATQRVGEILQDIGCQVTRLQQDWQVITPTWRVDLAIEEDLIEEVARLYGYQQIPSSNPYGRLILQDHPEAVLPLKRVRTLLVDRGYQEAITYSFVDPTLQQLLHPQQTALVLPHPISVKLSVMRLSLWCGLLSALSYNQKRQQSQVRLFETGLRFIPDSCAEQGVAQAQMLAGVISGNSYEEHWDHPCQKVDFFDIKGDLEVLFELTGYQDDVIFKKTIHPALHPGHSAAIYLRDEWIGCLGVLHPTVAYQLTEHQLTLNGSIILFELLLSKLTQRRIPQAKEISRFPANRRDIAVVVTEDVSAKDVIALCKKVSKRELVGINLFDVYRGGNLPEGYKSLAISLWVHSSSRTLEESEIAATISRVVIALQQQFQASLRT